MFESSFSNYWTMLENMKTRLTSFAALSYNEVVSIEKYRIDQLPDFDNYGIIINPLIERENNGNADDPTEGMINAAHFEWDVEIIALVRKYHPGKSLMGINPSGVPPADGVGILFHVATIKDALRANSLGGYLEVSKRELFGQVLISEIYSDNRDKFFNEVKIPWHGLGRFEVMPAVSA